MTKKDYILLAAAIAKIPNKDARYTANLYIGSALFKANERFDVYKFNKACGIYNNA
jgi:hypothetical protein